MPYQVDHARVIIVRAVVQRYLAAASQCLCNQRVGLIGIARVTATNSSLDPPLVWMIVQISSRVDLSTTCSSLRLYRRFLFCLSDGIDLRPYLNFALPDLPILCGVEFDLVPGAAAVAAPRRALFFMSPVAADSAAPTPMTPSCVSPVAYQLCLRICSTDHLGLYGHAKLAFSKPSSAHQRAQGIPAARPAPPSADSKGCSKRGSACPSLFQQFFFGERAKRKRRRADRFFRVRP